MMAGRITPELEAIVPLEVRALGGGPETVHAVLDTGFSEALALPFATIARLGLPYRGNELVTLADGSETEVGIYRAIVEWHGRVRPVTVFAVHGSALFGMALVEGSRVTFDAIPNGPVHIQPLA